VCAVMYCYVRGCCDDYVATGIVYISIIHSNGHVCHNAKL
jgi:hypothetical protein